MRIHLLGPVEASVEGRPVALDAGKPRAVLAMLALEAGTPVPAQRLMDGLWGDAPPATAGKLVQVYVSQVRKALTAAGAGSPVVTRGSAYELVVESDAVDLRAFERLVAQGRPREALALWRGPPLAGLTDQPFAADAARRLGELRLLALEAAIDSDLAAGRHDRAVSELEALVADEPLRERLWARLMLALYRAGRQAEALDAYHRVRALLVDAIGAEPGPELRRLQDAILRQDPSLELPAAAPAALPPALEPRTPLVGRDAELDRLHEHWRAARAGAGRLVALVGPAGIGKTRLAAELAAEVHRDRHGVRLVSGAGPSGTVLTALEEVGTERRPSLLVVDDADRLAEPAADAVRALGARLETAPALVLVVSRDHGTAATTGAVAAEALGPLDLDAVSAVTESYAAGAATGPAARRLLEVTGGVPRALHRAAADWARAEADRRLVASATRASGERSDLRAAEARLAGDVIKFAAVRERAGDLDAPADLVTCPFKGLAAYDVEDAPLFAGRERLVGEMVARLAGAPLMGIVGPSGSGKSSVLRAGLLPALAGGALPGSDGSTQSVMRPGGDPVRALHAAVSGRRPGDPAILAVDQFEEVFWACGQPERARFVDAVVDLALDPRAPVTVLIAVRADFYGRCAEHPELSRLLGANQVLVGPMRRDEVRRAIESPARRAGLRVEPALVDALAADVEGAAGALPLLSTALVELWERREGRDLRLAAYRESGGVEGAVARLGERVYGRLDAQQRTVARRLLVRLAGDGQAGSPVRRRAPISEVDDASDVLATLADERLVTLHDGEVEVAHEALLHEWPRLRGWLADDAAGHRTHRRLTVAAAEWDAGGRDAAELYRGARLAAVLEWADGRRDELGKVERAFLHESRIAAARAHRRLRAALAGVAVLLVAAVVAAGAAFQQRSVARDEAVAAEAQRIGARALVREDLDDALLFAREGVALDDTVQTRGTLLAALFRSPAAIGVLRGDGDRVGSTALSPDERTLAAGDPSGRVLLFDTERRRRTASLEPLDGNAWITALDFSPDGSRLAIGYDTPRGNEAGIFDVRSRRRLATMRPPPGGYVTGLEHSADGRTIDVLLFRPFPEAGPSLLTRFDARTGRRVRGSLAVNRRGPSPVMRTADGRRLVVGGVGETVVRDAVTLRVVRRLPTGGAPEADPGHDAYGLAPDGGTLAIGDPDGSLRLLDLRTGRVRSASAQHAAAISAVEYTPDGSRLVTTSDDGDVRVWDAHAAAGIETLTGHAGGTTSLEVTLDGTTLYTAGLDGAILIWDLDGGRRLGRPFRSAGDRAYLPGGAGGDVGAVALSPDGRQLATGEADGALSLVDLGTFSRRRTRPLAPTGESMRVRFIPRTRLVVVAGLDGHLVIADPRSGRVVRRLRGHRDRIYTPGVSADGRLMATGSTDGTVRLWSLPDGRPLGAPLRYDDLIFDTQVSPDGRWVTVALVHRDFRSGVIEVRDSRTRRVVRRTRIEDHPGFTRFSADGRLLVLGTRHGRAQVWSTADWRPVTRMLKGDAGGIAFAAISPNGRTVATGSDSGTLRLWDIPSQQPIGAPVPGVPSRPVLPLFTPDGTLIASYEGGRAYAWDLHGDTLMRHACAVATRRLTRQEWRDALPGRAYAPAC